MNLYPSVLVITTCLLAVILRINCFSIFDLQETWNDEVDIKTTYVLGSTRYTTLSIRFRNQTFEIIFDELRFGKKSNCYLCKTILPVIRDFVQWNKTDYLFRLSDILCSTVLRHTYTYEVCKRTVQAYYADAVEIIRESTLSPIQFCRMAFICPSISDDPSYDWNISIPEKNLAESVPEVTFSSPKTYRILHITDTHIQNTYTPGSDAKCRRPLCCEGGPVNDTSKQAGYFGDYRNCDLPPWTVEQIFKHISENEKFDFIYWTGDAPSHNIWNQTKPGNVNSTRGVADLFRKYFKGKKVYSTVGNHESQPCNLFPPSSVIVGGSQWLYSNLSSDWVNLGKLKATDVIKNISRGGFYTTLLARKFRLIALNTNYCTRENLWLYVNSYDPENQLSWLVEWLHHAESKGEKVHIIGHHFPSTCLKSWSFNYYRIVKRYQHVITGQFFGHEHYDDFRIFIDDANRSLAFAVAYLSPSITSFPNMNPGYRIYTINGNHKPNPYDVLDHETTILDLNASNALNEYVFQREYSIKDAFNLTSLSPDQLLSFTRQLHRNVNNELMEIFLRYRYKSRVQEKCDSKCRTAILCDLLVSRAGDRSNCAIFKIPKRFSGIYFITSMSTFIYFILILILIFKLCCF